MASAGVTLLVSRILVVDRDPVFRRFVREQVVPHAGTCVVVDEAVTWADASAANAADVILLAADRPDGDGLSDLPAACEHAPVIVTSSSGSLSLAVAAMRAGAADFLVKPIRLEALCAAIGRAASSARPLPAPVRRQATDFERFIGRSDIMRGVFEMISRIAPSRAPVFVTGESGTGKELTAEAIHARSGRTGAFVAINCAAIPRDLMESEIFGHVRGAFTGAQDARQGAAELADGGTLFLDEICEMDPDLQTKLLRFIQTGTVRRVGDTSLRPVDVRFVCATNRTPEAEVAAGRFRSDLYYRLHVLPVDLPPLRQRPEDILPIAEASLAVFAEEEGRAFRGFDADARALLLHYDWPGNVRQLQNVIRRVVVMNDGEEIAAAMLAMALAHAGQPGTVAANGNEPATLKPNTGGTSILAWNGNAAVAEEAAPSRLPVAIEPYWIQERRIIEQALEACRGNVGQAAAALEISPSTIYRKKQGWLTDSSAA